jgi:RNA polymerase sigma-70 factor (ECF subfamily)
MSDNILSVPACSTESETANDDSFDDSEFVARLLGDESQAWREFDARFSRLIYRCITRVTGRFSAVVGAEDVREIYALLYLQLLANDKHKLRSFEPGRGNRLGSWIGMLAIHSAYDYLRTLRREPRRGALAEAESLSSEIADPYEQYLLQERAGQVEDVLSEFSDKDREFIALYYGEGLEPEQVAERMDISIKTVYSKKHKIRSRLEALFRRPQLAA